MTTPTSYDSMPYISHPFLQTHPDRLATVATLLGLHPPPVLQCRVLELGCASGGNLIPMAESLPQSTFVGVDLSRAQVVDGQKAIAALGLTNLSLRHLSITDVDPNFGLFDYILCHGVYSWVPPAVQDHILTVCKQNLAPNGVAYISYNTLPGWHMRGMIRDMMTYHTSSLTDPTQRVGQARALLDFLAKSADDKNPYGMFLKSELEMLQRSSDTYVFHEHLEDFNEPIYFHQFVERAQAKGLRYLGEADINVMVPGHFPTEVANVLQQLAADLLHLEQYMDFLRNRMFRQTLLCHADREPCYQLKPEALRYFQVASPLRPAAADPKLRSHDFEQFDSPTGMSISSRDPIVKAALMVLGEAWPQTLPFPKLRTLARSRLKNSIVQDAASIAEDAHQLGQAFLQFYTNSPSGLVELRVRPITAANKVKERPVARPLARWQAGQGPWVTNLLHEMVTLGEFERHLLKQLDGQHDRRQLVEGLSALVTQGQLAVQQDGEPVTNPEQTRKLLREAIEPPLAQFARNALLIG